MRNLFLFFFTLVFINATGQEMHPQRPLKVIELSGNGYERGVQHGRALKKEIAELIILWKNDLQRSMKMNADTFIAHFLAYSDFKPAINKYTPDMLDEVKGIAEGAGQNFNDIYAFQLVDEYWVYQDRLWSDSTHHHCSSIGIPAMNGQPAYVSQNMDVEAWMDGYQVVLHIKKNGQVPEQYIFSSAGLVALNGINENSIGVCVNTLMTLNANTSGLPVAFMIRGLLTKTSQKDALEFIQTVPHASGQNYILGTGDSVYDFEASANKVIRFLPNASGLVYHTNHPLVNNDIKNWYQDYYKKFLAGTTQNQNSETRFAALRKRAGESGSLNDLFIKTTLRSKDDQKSPVCRTHYAQNGGFTFGSVILSLSGMPGMQLTAGPPDESEYRVFSFNK